MSAITKKSNLKLQFYIKMRLANSNQSTIRSKHTLCSDCCLPFLDLFMFSVAMLALDSPVVKSTKDGKKKLNMRIF